MSIFFISKFNNTILSNTTTSVEFSTVATKNSTKTDRSQNNNLKGTQYQNALSKAQTDGPDDPTPKELLDKAFEGKTLSAHEIIILAQVPEFGYEYFNLRIKRELNPDVPHELALIKAIAKIPENADSYVYFYLRKELNPNIPHEEILLNSIISNSKIATTYVTKKLNRILNLSKPHELRLFDSIMKSSYNANKYKEKFYHKPLNVKEPTELIIFKAILKNAEVAVDYVLVNYPYGLDDKAADQKLLLNAIAKDPFAVLKYADLVVDAYEERALDPKKPHEAKLLKTIMRDAGCVQSYLENALTTNVRNDHDAKQFFDYYVKVKVLPELLQKFTTVTVNPDGSQHVTFDQTAYNNPTVLAGARSNLETFLESFKNDEFDNFVSRFQEVGGRLPDKLFPLHHLEWAPLMGQSFTVDGVNIVELTTSNQLRHDGGILRHCLGDGAYASECSDPDNKGIVHILSLQKPDGTPTSSVELHIVPHGEGITVKGADFDIKVIQHKEKNDIPANKKDRQVLATFLDKITSGEVPLNVYNLKDVKSKLGQIIRKDANDTNVTFDKDCPEHIKNIIKNTLTALPTAQQLAEVDKAIEKQWCYTTNAAIEVLQHITNDGKILQAKLLGQNIKKKDGTVYFQPVGANNEMPKKTRLGSQDSAENVYDWYDVTNPNNVKKADYDKNKVSSTRVVRVQEINVFRKGKAKIVTIKTCDGAVGKNSNLLKIVEDDKGPVINRRIYDAEFSDPNSSGGKIAALMPNEIIVEIPPSEIKKIDDQNYKLVRHQTAQTKLINTYIGQSDSKNIVVVNSEKKTIEIHLKDAENPKKIMDRLTSDNFRPSIKCITYQNNEGKIEIGYIIELTTLDAQNVLFKIADEHAQKSKQIEDQKAREAEEEGELKAQPRVDEPPANQQAKPKDKLTPEEYAASRQDERGQQRKVKLHAELKAMRAKPNSTTVRDKANSSYGRSISHGNAAVSFVKATQALSEGDMVAMANHMTQAISSEIMATLKYWAPWLGNKIGREALEHFIRKSLPLTSAAFGFKEICEICNSRDPQIRKRCAATVASQLVEVLPQFLGVGGNVLKWAGIPDAISIAMNNVLGSLAPEYRAPPRAIEDIFNGANDVYHKRY